MEALTPMHLLFVLVGFMVLFGYRKLPDAARSVGRSMRIFRTELRALDDEAPSHAAEPEPRSVAELEREAVAAEELADRARARADEQEHRR